jgi:hypothetical protein
LPAYEKRSTAGLATKTRSPTFRENGRGVLCGGGGVVLVLVDVVVVVAVVVVVVVVVVTVLVSSARFRPDAAPPGRAPPRVPAPRGGEDSRRPSRITTTCAGMDFIGM